ncbi:unnamed protein product [Camellia sinensis]
MATASWSSSTLLQSQISGFGGGLRQSRSHPNSLTFCKDDEDRPNRRCMKRAASNQDRPPSITDTEPKDAYQMPLSDFDSE